VRCKSQDSVGEIGTVIWVGKRSENMDFRREMTREIIQISPTESWDLQLTLFSRRDAAAEYSRFKG